MSDITPEQRESARQFAERVSSSLTDENRARLLHAAQPILAALRPECDGDGGTLRVICTMSTLIADCLRLPLSDAADAIIDTSAAYALAAGLLIGVFEVPDGEYTSADLPGGYVPVLDTPDPMGMYL